MDNYLNTILGGRYEIQEIIGVGGMAVVYKAFDRQDSRIVAIKVLKDEFLANEEFRLRFKNESKAIAMLSHPNIVKVFDVYFSETLQYFVMEHVEGITLKEYIQQQNGVDWKEALHFVIQILRALQHAHDKGIIHRDIKPQNILLLQNGNIKVTDFGIAHFNRGENNIVMDTEAIGSVHYVSPEQARGEYTDEKSDIYSVGVVLYEMLTGRLPFEAESSSAVAVMQIEKEPVKPTLINNSVPIGLEQITMRSMQKNPRDRYQSAAEFLLDLDEFRRNPLIKFDYSFFIDNTPTKYLNISSSVIPSSSPARVDEQMPSVKTERKTVVSNPASTQVKKKKRKNDDTPKEEEPDDMQEDDEFVYKSRNLTVPLLAAVCVAVLVVIGIVMLIVFFDPIASYFSKSENGKVNKVITYFENIFGEEEIEVPNFINMTFDEVKAQYPDLKFEDPVYELNSEYEAGKVCFQTPAAATVMTKNTVVKLTIARSATSQVAVPNVVGKNYVTAQSELKAYGFTVVVTPVYVQNQTVGNVIRTDPVAGTMLETLKTVTVYYASAVNSDVVEVPSVVGYTREEAEKMITAVGLVCSVTEEDSSADKKGIVLSQTPEADTDYKVAKGSAVHIVVGSGEMEEQTVRFNITLPSTDSVGTLSIYLNDKLYEMYDKVNFNGAAVSVTISGTGANNTFKILADDTVIYTGTINFSGNPATVTSLVKQEDTSKKTGIVPNVTGYTETVAKQVLKTAGFTNVTVKTVESDEPAGTVFAQLPLYNANTKVDLTSTVTIYISTGAQSSDVTPSSYYPTQTPSTEEYDEPTPSRWNTEPTENTQGYIEQDEDGNNNPFWFG